MEYFHHFMIKFELWRCESSQGPRLATLGNTSHDASMTEAPRAGEEAVEAPYPMVSPKGLHASLRYVLALLTKSSPKGRAAGRPEDLLVGDKTVKFLAWTASELSQMQMGGYKCHWTSNEIRLGMESLVALGNGGSGNTLFATKRKTMRGRGENGVLFLANVELLGRFDVAKLLSAVDADAKHVEGAHSDFMRVESARYAPLLDEQSRLRWRESEAEAIQKTFSEMANRALQVRKARCAGTRLVANDPIPRPFPTTGSPTSRVRQIGRR